MKYLAKEMALSRSKNIKINILKKLVIICLKIIIDLNFNDFKQ